MMIIAGAEDTRHGYILADGTHIECGEDTVCGLVVSLIACYYAWGLMYPKHFQILAFMQAHFIRDQKNLVQHGARLTKFEKLYVEFGDDK